jgi:hypothetical protein
MVKGIADANTRLARYPGIGKKLSAEVLAISPVEDNSCS